MKSTAAQLEVFLEDYKDLVVDAGYDNTDATMLLLDLLRDVTLTAPAVEAWEENDGNVEHFDEFTAKIKIRLTRMSARDRLTAVSRDKPSSMHDNDKGAASYERKPKGDKKGRKNDKGGRGDVYGVGGKGGGGVPDKRPGDWECKFCHANVFASEEKCFKCGADKEGNGGKLHQQSKGSSKGKDLQLKKLEDSGKGGVDKREKGKKLLAALVQLIGQSSESGAAARELSCSCETEDGTAWLDGLKPPVTEAAREAYERGRLNELHPELVQAILNGDIHPNVIESIDDGMVKEELLAYQHVRRRRRELQSLGPEENQRVLDELDKLAPVEEDLRKQVEALRREREILLEAVRQNERALELTNDMKNQTTELEPSGVDATETKNQDDMCAVTMSKFVVADTGSSKHIEGGLRGREKFPDNAKFTTCGGVQKSEGKVQIENGKKASVLPSSPDTRSVGLMTTEDQSAFIQAGDIAGFLDMTQDEVAELLAK